MLYLWIIAGSLGFLSLFFALLAGCLNYLEDFHNKKRSVIRAWFRTQCAVIDQNRWIEMPELVIRWLLMCPERLLVGFVRNHSMHCGDVVATLLGGMLAFYFTEGPGWLLFFSKWIIPFGVIGLYRYYFVRKSKASACSSKPLMRFCYTTTLWFLGTLWTASIIYIGCDQFLGDPIFRLFVMACVLPFIGVFTAMWVTTGINVHAEGMAPTSSVAFIVITSSVAISLLAMDIGYALYPNMWIPQTFQMLAANAACDALTVFFVFIALAWAVSRPGIFRIPFAVLLATLLAAALSFCSVFFGLCHTDRHLEAFAIFRLFVGRSLDGTKWEFGPIFWTMHTTFLPVLIYMRLVVSCWEVKVLLIPTRKFLAKARSHNRPLKLTAGLCTVISLFFGLSSTIVGFAPQYYAKLVVLEHECARGTSQRSDSSRKSNVPGNLGNPSMRSKMNAPAESVQSRQ